MSPDPRLASSIVQIRQAINEFVKDKPHLQYFCSDACIIRYLNARGHCLSKALEMLMDTLRWRDSFRMHELSWPDVAAQAATGKVMLAPVPSRDGRPIMVLRPHHENNTKDQEANIRHFAYQIETVCRIADKQTQDGKIITLIDYTGFSMRRNPPMKTSLAILKILQHHYPERLHVLVCWHPPTAFSAFWKMISPFVDPVTSKKLLMLTKSDKTAHARLAEIVDVRALDSSVGGVVPDVYDQGKWSKLMQAEDEEYRQGLQRYVDSKASIMSANGMAAIGT